jgi:hypothetical protein
LIGFADMGYKGAAYATICAKGFGFYFCKKLIFLYDLGTICFFACMFLCCPKKIRRKYKFFRLKQIIPNIKQMLFCFIMGLGFSIE